MTRSLRTYDHRLRELVRETGDVTIATSAGVPRSTAAGWLRRPARSTVTLDPLSMDQQGLQAEVLRLQGRAERLRAAARILVATMNATDVDLSRRRVADGASKSKIVRAVERGRGVLRLRKALALIGLSPSRFHAWKRADMPCDLDDHSSCPKTSPQRVTSSEIQAIKDSRDDPTCRESKSAFPTARGLGTARVVPASEIMK